MEKEKFTHNLIQIAFCSMVCDSHIDESEISELNEIAKKDFYFDGYSVSEEINLLEKEFNKRGLILVEDILNEQIFLDYSETQKIIILEVVIDIVKADKKIEMEEINFINQLIINLRVPSEIVKSRFGNWDSLSDELYDDKSD